MPTQLIKAPEIADVLTQRRLRATTQYIGIFLLVTAIYHILRTVLGFTPFIGIYLHFADRTASGWDPLWSGLMLIQILFAGGLASREAWARFGMLLLLPFEVGYLFIGQAGGGHTIEELYPEMRIYAFLLALAWMGLIIGRREFRIPTLFDYSWIGTALAVVMDFVFMAVPSMMAGTISEAYANSWCITACEIQPLFLGVAQIPYLTAAYVLARMLERPKTAKGILYAGIIGAVLNLLALPWILRSWH
jgi:hypothetical protein